MSRARSLFHRFVQFSSVSFVGIALLAVDETFNSKKIQISIGSFIFRSSWIPSATASATTSLLKRLEDKAKRPKVGLGCLILKRDKSDGSLSFLVGVRRSSHGEGLYALPGGHLEFGESWQQCAYNEVLEETELDIEPEKWQFAFVNNSIAPSKEEGERLHYIDIIMSTLYEGEQEPVNAEPLKCDGWQWVKWGQHNLEKERTFCGLKAILESKHFDPENINQHAPFVAFDQWKHLENNE